jgi:Zn-dependent peptidase ImmA (M78 family)
MPYLEDDLVETKSRNFRQEVGIDDRAVPDLIFVLGEMKRLKKICDYKVVADKDLPGALAKYDSDKRIIFLNQSTFDALDFPNHVGQQERRRSRFTVAHEIAHAILHHDGFLSRGPREKVLALGRRARSLEYEANRVAAAILAPTHIIDRAVESIHDRFDAEAASTLFEIGFQAATIRLETVSRLKRRATVRQRPLPTSYANFLRTLQATGARIESLEADDALKSRDAIAKGFLGVHCKGCGNFTLKKSDSGISCKTCSLDQ